MSRHRQRDMPVSAVAVWLLREYKETPDAKILWCTFEGIVRGPPDVDGCRPPSAESFHDFGYFSRAEGLQHLETIRAAWEAYDGRDVPRIEIRMPSRCSPLSSLPVSASPSSVSRHGRRTR